MARIPEIPTILVATTVFTDSFMQDDLRTLGQWARVIPFEITRWHTNRRRYWGLRGVYILLRF
jgi:hypothetical protein